MKTRLRQNRYSLHDSLSSRRAVSRPSLAPISGYTWMSLREHNAAAPSTRWTHPLCTFRVHRGGHREGEGDAHLNYTERCYGLC